MEYVGRVKQSTRFSSRFQGLFLFSLSIHHGKTMVLQELIKISVFM